jgi:uncharacterized protein YjbI with pentapeptide repeats
MSTSHQSIEKISDTISFHARQVQDLPWRTEPEIDAERQRYLVERLAITPDIERGIYSLRDVKLGRADIEWMLATQENRRGPRGWNGEHRPAQVGLDLRGADLRQINLSGMPLARMFGGRNWVVQFPSIEEQRDLARVHLEGADLGGAHLEEAFLGGAHLEEAFLGGAHLEGAYLREVHLEGSDLEGARLEGANLVGAHLEGANLVGAHLEGANLVGAHLEGANLVGARLEGANLVGAHLEGANLVGAHLEGANLVGASLRGKPVSADYLKRVRQWDKETLLPANLQGAFFNSATTLEDIILGEEKYGFVSLADVHWGGVNLSVVDWDAVTMLGDERRARQTTWLYSYQVAVRAYRQLAAVSREQGLNEEALRFAYRAELLQRRVLWRQMLQLRRRGRKGLRRLMHKMVDYFFSWLFDLLAGYGYKPLRSLIAYPLVIGTFTVIFYALGMVYGPHLSWGELLAMSMASFHGRSFFPDQSYLAGPQAFVALLEAFVGVIIEVSFIVAFVQRFFRK